MRSFGLPVLHFLGELALHPHYRRVVFLWQRLTFQFRPALDRAENFRNVFRDDSAACIEKEQLLETFGGFALGRRRFAKHELALVRGRPGGADAVPQIGNSFVLTRVLLAQLAQNLLGFVKVEEFVFLILEQTQLAAVLLLVNRIHGLFVEILRSVKNLRILADGIVNLLDAILQLLLQSEVPVETRFRQEIETVNDIVIAANAINAAEALNELNRIPVEIVIDDVVAVLKVQAFRQYVGRNYREQLLLTGLESVLGICLRRKAAHNTRLAFVA